MQLGDGVIWTNIGDVKIGVGGNPVTGIVTLGESVTLTVNGTLAVGAEGTGTLALPTLGSVTICDTLIVGGNTPNSTGTGSIVSSLAIPLTVRGNADVGTGMGGGEIHLGGTLTIGGSLSIGNPAAGPGGGVVALESGRIEGAGNIVVNPNGSLIGTGTIDLCSVCVVHAGGLISPGLSPGTLTINGHYEQLPTGVLIVEYNGMDPGAFDVLHVTGETTLAGRLEVHFRGGFSPDDPNAFIHSQSFVQADQGITGDYDQRIYAFPDIFADFDEDGDKDLFDVAEFQNCFGLSGKAFLPACDRADWEDNNAVDEMDARELSARLTRPQ